MSHRLPEDFEAEIYLAIHSDVKEAGVDAAQHYLTHGINEKREYKKTLKAGDRHYKAYVGPPDRYDFMGATQFRLLTALGLRANNKLLDFGCGSLRSGKLFIPYLNAGNYYGQEPNQWLIDDGIKNELGNDLIQIKKPNFSNKDDFTIGFNEKFDFIVAQSIFSHTNLDLTIKGLKSIFQSLAETGLAVVTIIEGSDYVGEDAWVYPHCTTYSPSTIEAIFDEVGCEWCRLHWFHPAQTWFALAHDKTVLPSKEDVLMLLGGEEVNSRQYNKQNFISNRMFSLSKKFPGKNEIELACEAEVADAMVSVSDKVKQLK
jgi:SAM-dependent methyltransferase